MHSAFSVRLTSPQTSPVFTVLELFLDPQMSMNSILLIFCLVSFPFTILLTVVLISIFRLNPLITPPVEKSPMMTLTLQEVLIVGSCSDQVKFSELTLDMFRMLQTLEREPQEDLVQMYDASPAPGRMPLVRRTFCFFG